MDEMLDRARRIVAAQRDEEGVAVDLAEALLAEHDARVQAESGQFDLKMAMEALRDRAEQAERERDQKRDEAMRNYRWGSQMCSRVVALEAALRECSVQAWHGRSEAVRAIVDTVLAGGSDES